MQAALTSTAQAFQIKYHRGKRSVYCDHCKSPASNSIVSHLKKKHPQVWRSYVKTFAELREQGMFVARRTVAKYREAIHILPSTLRSRAYHNMARARMAS